MSQLVWCFYQQYITSSGITLCGIYWQLLCYFQDYIRICTFSPSPRSPSAYGFSRASSSFSARNGRSSSGSTSFRRGRQYADATFPEENHSSSTRRSRYVSEDPHCGFLSIYIVESLKVPHCWIICWRSTLWGHFVKIHIVGSLSEDRHCGFTFCRSTLWGYFLKIHIVVITCWRSIL